MRAWGRVTDWLQTVFGCHCPSSDQFVAYLLARAAEPCGKTAPTQCYKTLPFMEAAGGVAHEARISPHPAVHCSCDTSRDCVALPCNFAVTADEAWTKTLTGAGIPEHVCKKLEDMQYTTADSFCFKDEATFEAFVKHLLLMEKVEIGVDESSWVFHPLCGKLKGLWPEF